MSGKDDLAAFSPVYAGGELDSTDMTGGPMEGDANEEYRSKWTLAPNTTSLAPGNWHADWADSTRIVEKEDWNHFAGGWDDLVKEVAVEGQGVSIVTSRGVVFE